MHDDDAHAGHLRHPRWQRCAMSAVLLVVSACASPPSTPSRASKPAATPTGAPAPTEQALPYYVGVAGLSLYPEPRAANQKTTLPLHQKVTRTRLERGWAFVTVEGSGEQGWVDNAKLIWRLPKTDQASGARPAATADAAPVLSPSEPPAATAPRETTQPPTSPQPAEGTRPASALDPF